MTQLENPMRLKLTLRLTSHRSVKFKQPILIAEARFGSDGSYGVLITDFMPLAMTVVTLFSHPEEWEKCLWESGQGAHWV